MKIGSAGNKIITIVLITASALCVCGPVFGGNTKDKDKPAVKLPVFEDAKNIKFDEDDQKFFAWLNKYFPEEAENLKYFENNPAEYQNKFMPIKSRFRRLWKGYKESKKLGEALVVEVKLRIARNGVLDKYKAASDKKAKDAFYRELNKVVSKEFDIAMEIKRIRYEGLRPRILRMTNYLTKREKEITQLVEHKDAEVKKRVVELFKEGKEDPNWRYPKNKGIAPKKGPSVKLAVIKDVKFSSDDQKFFAWLYEFFPNYAQDIKDLEKKPKEYVEEFNKNRSMFRRLFRRVWRGHRFTKQYDKFLVEEVKLRVDRFGVLNKLKTANEKQKAKLRNDLTSIVSKEFDLTVKLKNGQYNGLRRRIKRMEQELAKRENEVKKLVANKAEEVKNRVKDLITGEEKINWK